jgi:hypothetical protein
MKTKQNLADLYQEDPIKACRLALRQTVNVRWQDRLEAIDKLMGTCGTEAIRGEWQNGYWCDIVAVYCNTGDAYAVTVIHVRGGGWNPGGRFVVGTVGDWFERNEKHYQLQ